MSSYRLKFEPTVTAAGNRTAHIHHYLNKPGMTNY